MHIGFPGCNAITTARTSSGHDECRRGCSHCSPSGKCRTSHVVQQAPPQAPVAAPVQAHAFPSAWERVRDAFQKAHPPEFAGSSDVVVSSQWRKDIQRHLRMYECTDVQKQVLATFKLVGSALQWWESITTVEERDTLTI